MKKWIYKTIFLMVFAVVGLFMISKKEVKALEQQTYPATIMKATYYQVIYLQENANTYEFRVDYVLENVVLDDLNENEYFFITEKYIAFRKGINRNANTYTLEEIETGSDFTIFNIRFTVNKNFADNEYGINYMIRFFWYDSSLYIKYDAYSKGYEDGYGEGFSNGRDYGRSMGYQEGYVEGQYEGYWSGYEEGYDVGYEEGYEFGYEEGDWYGYHEGYEIGYDLGYGNGYNQGVSENIETGGFGLVLKQVFGGIGAFLGIQLLPGISIGAIIAVPIVFGIIAFILGRRKE